MYHFSCPKFSETISVHEFEVEKFSPTQYVSTNESCERYISFYQIDRVGSSDDGRSLEMDSFDPDKNNFVSKLISYYLREINEYQHNVAHLERKLNILYNAQYEVVRHDSLLL